MKEERERKGKGWGPVELRPGSLRGPATTGWMLGCGGTKMVEGIKTAVPPTLLTVPQVPRTVPPFLRELLFPLENSPRMMNEVPRAVTVAVSQSNFSRWERSRLIFRLLFFFFFFLSLLFRVAWELRKLFRSRRALCFPQQKVRTRVFD